EPIERKDGSHKVEVLKGCQSIDKTVHDYVYDIGLLKSLHDLLLNDNVRSEVSSSRTSAL
uniref:Uncharacterized protein n=1 Tax=Amphimedon queenslandica TaxID=400682 RepID=A0A1X7T956_AMPQE